MSRELIEKLIDLKAKLNAELFEIDEKLSATPPEHLWVTNHDDSIELTPAQAKVKESFLALNANKLTIQEQLKRAHIFGQRHTKGVIPTLCLDCFVFHDLSSKMVETASRLGNGIRTFKCGKPCGYELSVDETIPQPGSV